jgi:hypothetical protein
MAEHIVQPFHSVQAVPDSIGDSQARAPLGQQTEESVVRPNAVPTQEPTRTAGKTVITPPVSLRRSPFSGLRQQVVSS